LLSASSSFVKLLGTRKARISQIGQKQSLPVLVSHSYTLRLSRERSIHSVFFGESVHLGVCTQNNCNFVRGRDQAQSRSDTRRSDMSLHRFSRTEFSPRVVSEGPLLAVNPPPIPDHCSSLVKGSGEGQPPPAIPKPCVRLGRAARGVPKQPRQRGGAGQGTRFSSKCLRPRHSAMWRTPLSPGERARCTPRGASPPTWASDDHCLRIPPARH
jgi:hypothetical protein